MRRRKRELGYLAMVQNDLPAAARYFERALALDPTDLDVLGNSARLLQTLGRLPPAIAIDEYVVARDPVNPIALQNLGINYLYAGRYDEAIAKFRTLLSLSPGYGGAHFLLGEALLLKGDAAGGLAQMQQEKTEGWRLIGLPLAYCALGRKADADAAFAALIAKYAKDAPYNIAYDYAYCGEADQAFAWLDKAVAYQDPGLSGIVTETLFDKIRHDPRWLPFLRKLGYAPEQLAKIKFTVTLPGAADAARASAASPAVETSPHAPHAGAGTRHDRGDATAMSTQPSFFAELKRRNVLRAGVLYAGAVWALAQGIAQLAHRSVLPDWITRWFRDRRRSSAFRSGSRSPGSTSSRRAG